jgi:hypothetical protein
MILLILFETGVPSGANTIPPLVVHSGSGPSANDHWEKNSLTSDELQAIKPLLERIWTLKQQGLTGLGSSPAICVAEFNP